MFQALRSVSGQRSSGSERTLLFAGRTSSMRSSQRSPHVSGDRAKFDLLANEISELLGRLRGLQAA